MSITSTKPSMIRYNGLTINLYPINAEANYSDPFEFEDPFDENEDGLVYPVTLKKIIYSSDATPSILSGTIADVSVAGRNIVMSNSDSFSNNTQIPYVGWGISVDVTEDNKHTGANAVTRAAGSSSRIFKGYISSISRQIGQNGIFYDFEARDIKCRLTYQTIKKTYNATYKSAGVPIIGEGRIIGEEEYDKPYIAGNLTVKMILEDILNYAMKTSSNGVSSKTYEDFIGFSIDDFVFNDTYLENFVPQTIAFDNVTILEAIYKLINTAGPYRMVCEYDSSGGDDKIYFSSLNGKCRNCGSEVVLKYGSTSSQKEFSAVNVVSDTTYRKIYDACNIMKSYTGQIEWYSGHFYIEKGKTSNSIKSKCSSTGGITKNILSCKNWDGYNYYFGLKSVPYGEGSSNSNSNFVIVGAPLYPAFDPNSGYGPCQSSFVTFLDDPDNPSDDLPANGGGVCLTLNGGITENDRKFIKHRNFIDTVGRDRIKSSVGVSYVAYVPYDICWACNGSGAVENDCSNSKYAHIFGNTRALDGTKTCDISFTPFSYGFTKATYESKGEGMQPYVGNGYTVPANHPLPWKNTCPVCRGTGVEPWFKMGTILNSLIDISPSQTKIGEATSNRIGVSNSASLCIDRTYGQITEDMSYKYPVMIHTESATNYMAYAQDLESNSSSWMHHPLYNVKQVEFHNSNTQASVNTNAKIFPDGSDGSERAEDKSSQYVQALYYTQIQDATGYQIDTDRSLVIFNNANFIPYRAPMATIKEVMSKNGIKAPAYDPKLKCFRYSMKGEMSGVGQNVGSYWRPARAWITCYFKRDRLEEFLNKEATITREMTGGAGTASDDYKVCPRIEDNRYCAEIRKTSKDSEHVEEFNTRPIARGFFCDDFKWQVHPWDYKKILVPSADDDQEFTVPTDYSDMWKSNGVYANCVSKGYCFPCGKILKFEKMREIEARTLYNKGIDLSQVLKTDMFGKVLAWAHKDDRMKLFEKACAELERRNNIQVSGTVVIRGEIPRFTGGMGYVTLYDNMKACIVKIELTFGTNFLMSLEVGTEEMRVGQKKESEKDYDRLIQDTLSDLKGAKTSVGANGPVDTVDSSDNVTTMGPISVGGGVAL